MSHLCLMLGTPLMSILLGVKSICCDFQLKHEMSNIIRDMIANYTGVNKTAEHTWDYIQKSVRFQ